MQGKCNQSVAFHTESLKLMLGSLPHKILKFTTRKLMQFKRLFFLNITRACDG
jgi:hypothetical protein